MVSEPCEGASAQIARMFAFVVAAKVVRSLPNMNILFVPDRNLANHVAQQVPEKNIIPWEGFCYVHQQITPQEIMRIRDADPDLKILVHPECRAEANRVPEARYRFLRVDKARVDSTL